MGHGRRKLSSENGQCDARAIFEQACADSFNLDKFCVRRDQSWGEFKVVNPFDCPDWKLHDIFVDNDYIATYHRIQHRSCPRSRLGNAIQLYDRWTLQMVNAISIPCSENLFLEFVDNSVFIRRKTGRCSPEKWGNSIVWNQATGKMHILNQSSLPLVGFIFVSKLIVLLKGNGHHTFASVYKCDNESSNTPELIVDDEPLCMGISELGLGAPSGIQGDESLEFIGIVGHAYESWRNVFQLRSKKDFSLRRVFIYDASECPFIRGPDSTFLLSDCFVVVAGRSSLDVLLWIDGKVRTVYTFNKSEETCKNLASATSISLVGNFLVLRGESCWIKGFAYIAAIWKLPSNFLEICLRHLNEGTVGVTSECDQLVGFYMEPNFYHGFSIRVDRYGVTKIQYGDGKNGIVMHVMMLDSMILDEEY